MRDASDETAQLELNPSKPTNRKHKHTESLNSHFDGGAQQIYSNSIVSNGEVIEYENMCEDVALEGDHSNCDTTPGK